MTPEQIETWLADNSHRFDGPSQMLGDEPNAPRKPWDGHQVRWLIAAAWPYFHGAGNQSIPAVCQTINDHPECLADRWYLPETPRDFRMLERSGIGVFGVESKHPMADFDVVGTSISYTVLAMNFCNTGEAPVWMADGTFKPISKVQVGDEVMGWKWVSGGRWGKQRKLIASRVEAIAARQAPVVKAVFESGRVVRCTPDHQWLAYNSGNAPCGQDSWTHVGGKTPEYAHRERSGRTAHMGTIHEVIKPPVALTADQQREADWLAGMYDGEGSTYTISQSWDHNPEVCQRIETALTALNIPFSVGYTNHGVRRYMMTGGRQTYVNWLAWTNGVKREWFEKKVAGYLYGRGDRVTLIDPDGVDEVYSMQTETGNYVAWGLASKNCRYLTASGIPLRWRDREASAGSWPMVIIGGQSYCAPGQYEPIADCVWLGEVEDEEGNGGLGTVCSRIAAFKEDGIWQADRIECYRMLAREFNYLYFPRFTEVLYGYEEREGLEHPSKQVTGYRSLLAGQRMPFRARHVIDMDAIEPLRSAPLLFVNPAMGAGDLEVGRGCPAWCSFCRLSWVSKPYRQRTVDMTVKQAEAWVLAMGSNELSPFSPDFPMHTMKKVLLSRLLGVTDELDTATMRVDDFIADNEYILVQTFGGMDSVTLGLEGGSQRMRDAVGKGTSDQDVLDAFTSGIRAGVRKFKFYMITNLPGEEPGDVMRIIRLGHKLAQLRTKLGQDNVLIQFSWTPLLIEAQTPMQWFASTPPDHTLIDAIDALRDLKIQIKIGTKAEPNKVALFQLAQRASRDVGEAMCDVFERLNTACWGGVPRTMREDLEAALKARGFHNGLADCIGERFENDLFGWEFISTGVEKSLMWTTYRQMVEFLEGTDAETYDEQLPDDYHGAEFVARCDQTCLGKSCGACKPADLRKRTGYIRAAANERKIDLSNLRPIDLTTEAQRVRVRLEVAQRYRQADPIFWRHVVRRAAYRAAHDLRPVLPEGCNISKRSIRLASDQISVRDWSFGTDWLDFALTRKVHDGSQGALLLDSMKRELEPWAELGDVWAPYPVSAPLSGSLTAFYEVEAHTEDPDELAARFAAWDRAETIPLTLTADTSYFGLGTEEVDAKALVRDMWAVADDRRLVVRFLADGKAGPYQLYAALAGKSGWVSHAGRHARRLEWLDYAASPENCTDCGEPLPLTVLGELWSEEYCPRCSDWVAGWSAGGLSRGALVR